MIFNALWSWTIILACSWAFPNATLISSSKVMYRRVAQASLTSSPHSVLRLMALVSRGSTPPFTKSCLFCSCFKQQWRIVRKPIDVTAGSSRYLFRISMRRVWPSAFNKSGCPLVSADRAEREAITPSLSSKLLLQQERMTGYASSVEARCRWANPMEHCSVKRFRSEMISLSAVMVVMSPVFFKASSAFKRK